MRGLAVARPRIPMACGFIRFGLSHAIERAAKMLNARLWTIELMPAAAVVSRPRSRYRVSGPNFRNLPGGRDHHRAGRQSVVRRVLCEQDQENHDRWSDNGVSDS